MASRSDIIPRGVAIQEKVSNPWIWEWLERDEKTGIPYGQEFEKLKAPGLAYCKICRTEISYGSSGLKALRDHRRSKKHQIIYEQSKQHFHSSEQGIDTSSGQDTQSCIQTAAVLDPALVPPSSSHCIKIEIDNPEDDLPCTFALPPVRQPNSCFSRRKLQNKRLQSNTGTISDENELFSKWLVSQLEVNDKNKEVLDKKKVVLDKQSMVLDKQNAVLEMQKIKMELEIRKLKSELMLLPRVDES